MLRGAEQLMLLERETTQPMRLEELRVHLAQPNEDGAQLTETDKKTTSAPVAGEQPPLLPEP